MFALEAAESFDPVKVVRYRAIASETLQSDVDPEELLSVWYQGLIRLATDDLDTKFVEADPDDGIAFKLAS